MILSNDKFDELLWSKNSKEDSDKLGEEIYNELSRLGLDMEDFDSYSDMYKHLDKAGKAKISELISSMEDEIEESFEDDIWDYEEEDINSDSVIQDIILGKLNIQTMSKEEIENLIEDNDLLPEEIDYIWDCYKG